MRPSFQKQPSPTTAFTDNSAKLWCNVTTGYPSFTTAWYINAVRIIPDNNKYIFSNIDRSLTVTKLSWSDAGGYQCLADNLAGQAILTGLLSVRSKF